MNKDKIVISGIAGVFPNSKNVAELYANLNDKKLLFSPPDPSWKIVNPGLPPVIGRQPLQTKFDSGFFGVHHKQAEDMHQNCRKLLELSVEAVIDSGMNPMDLKGTNTAVFVAGPDVESKAEWIWQKPLSPNFGIPGSVSSTLAEWISYHLQLEGKSVTLDTACSSSLYAIDYAVKAIRSGRCNSALICGANALQNPHVHCGFHGLGVLDQNGENNVFDDSCSGYIRSEATAVIFVQKLQNAKRTYAEILNTLTNSDGFKETGITHSSSEMMAELFRNVYDSVKVDPSTVDFIESHVTGTIVGLVQEIQAVENVFCMGRKTPLLIGSVKANLGHCEPVSGLVSLIKILLGLQHNFILPNPTCLMVKSQVEAFQNGKIKIATDKICLRSNRDVIIGCNNSGIGGTNAHLVLKHCSQLNSIEQPRHLSRLVCFSARTMSSLTKIADSLTDNPTEDYLLLLQNIFRRNIYNHWYRGYVVLSQENILEKYYNNYWDQKVQLCLVYSEANQDWLSSFNLIQKTPTFSKSFKRIQNVLLPKGIDVTLLWNKNQKLDRGDLVVATVALQIAITDLVKHVLQDQIVFAESFFNGTITGAYANKVLTLENAMLLTVELRNRVMKKKLTKDECKNAESNILKGFNSLCRKTTEDTCNIVNGNTVKLVIGIDEDQNHLNFGPNTTLLQIFGRLYNLGFNLDLDKLYPKLSWPVRVPLVSPLIEWQHEDDWHVLKYQPRNLHKCVVTVSLNNSEWKFLEGHVIDGLNVFPATAYLYIAWNCYLKSRSLLMENTKIFFENVKFRRVMILSKEKPLVLTVEITKLQNNFEIKEDGECLVSGKICSSTTSCEIRPSFQNTTQETMQSKDIYKKLNLHGYNYKDAFCCVQESNLNGTVGLIKWNNWTTLLDAMEHFTILNKKLDELYVPVEIDQLVIDPVHHAQALKKHNDVLPVFYKQSSNTICVPGVELRNLRISTIKKRSEKNPILSIYKFVPFDTDITLKDSIVVHIQLVIENSGNVLKITEVVDTFTNDVGQLLSPIIDEVLENEIRVDKSLTIYSTETFEHLNITIEEKKIQQLPSDASLVIISRGSQRPKVIAQILHNRNCFVLSREALSYEAFNHVEVVSVHRTNLETFVLMRNTHNITKTIIEITSNFDWLGQVQTALADDKNILLVAQNDSTSGILGLVNCLKQEVGQNVSSVFLPNTATKFDVEDDVYQSQLRKGLLINVLQNGMWGSYRHLPLHENREECTHSICVASSGDLSTVQYVEGPLTKNTSELDEILVDVYYSGLNFKDVVVATGRINLNDTKQYRSNFEPIGFEFSGKDLRGKRIMGIGSSSAFSNYTLVKTGSICEVPDKWSIEDAATVPITYSTVLYALLTICRLKRGQSILIHSGTGGIGQSAINTAMSYNCNIFTTVGSEKKRKYLMSLYPAIPDSHIGNSRDSTFEQLILKQTKGRGVDVILNSLSEEKLITSTRCLARKGIFLELGKYDSLSNNPLSADTFLDGRTYAGIHLDMFFNADVVKQKQVMSLLRHGIHKGYVKPLQRVVFDKDKVQDALHYMSLGNHTGKIVIKFKDESINVDAPLKAKPRFFCNADKVYVIIGGLGGFGIELADWLIGRGARKLLLISRSGVTTGYQKFKLRYWRTLGCKTLVADNDLSNKEACVNLLTKANVLGEVDGIFNLAAVLDDALIENQTKTTFQNVLSPKVSITRNMDIISRILCPKLRQFVVFSSVACGRGNSGQTNYAMANSIMERICEHRKKEGYPGLAIQWGLIGDVGLVAEKLSTEINFHGLVEQKISSCLSVLDTFLTQNEPVVSSIMVNSKKPEKLSKSQKFLDVISEILRLTNIKHVSKHSSLSSLGMDSIASVQIKQFLESQCNLYLNPNELRSMTLFMLMEKSNIKID